MNALELVIFCGSLFLIAEILLLRRLTRRQRKGRKVSNPILLGQCWPLAPGMGFIDEIGGTVTQAVNSAYSFGVSGAGVNLNFQAPATDTITDFYFFVSATAGTGGSALVELRGDKGSSGFTPSATLIASQTVSTLTANTWCHVQFVTPGSVSQATHYNLCITNADASPATNNFTVMYGLAPSSSHNLSKQWFASGTTSNGFSSVSTVNLALGVIKTGTGIIVGFPYTSGATGETNNGLRRGMIINTLDSDVALMGVVTDQGNAQFTAIEIYKGNAAPGSPTFTIPVDLGGYDGLLFPEVVLSANTIWRIVGKPITTATNPRYIQIGDYADFADVQNCALGQGKFYHTIDNGAGGWTDDQSKLPIISLLFNRVGAVVGNGGTGGTGGSTQIIGG